MRVNVIQLFVGKSRHAACHCLHLKLLSNGTSQEHPFEAIPGSRRFLPFSDDALGALSSFRGGMSVF
jgi:hypothetical protein